MAKKKKASSQEDATFYQFRLMEGGRCVQKINFKKKDVEITDRVRDIARFPVGDCVMRFKNREIGDFFDLKI